MALILNGIDSAKCFFWVDEYNMVGCGQQQYLSKRAQYTFCFSNQSVLTLEKAVMAKYIDSCVIGWLDICVNEH